MKISYFPNSLEFPNYSDKNYWRIHYENVSGSFDWYDDYETISPLIKQLQLKKKSVILHIGIGNSEFSEKMYDEGYKKSYNIDYARNVIHYMKNRNKRLRSSMIFETMNVLDLDYEDNQFDIVFDKAVFDCVLCGIDADNKAKTFMKEIYRIIKPNGYYFLVSNTGPENRLRYLQGRNLKYDIFVHSIINDKKQMEIYKKNEIKPDFFKKDHYIYICKKVEVIEKENIIEVEKSEKKEIIADEKNKNYKEKKIIKGEKRDKENNIQNYEEIYAPIYKTNSENYKVINVDRGTNSEKKEEDKKTIKSQDKNKRNKNSEITAKKNDSP